MSTGRFNRWERTDGSVVQTVVQMKSTLYQDWNTLTIDQTPRDVPGLSVTITPTSATSKIRIDVRWMGEVSGAWDVVFDIRRNGLAINQGNALETRHLGMFLPLQSYINDDNNSTPECAFFSTIDTPNTTQAVVYTMAATANGSRALWTGRTMGGTDYGYEKCSCEIIVTEYLS